MTNLLDELRQFTGSEVFYRHGLFRKYIYTEGVQYLAKNAGAYWLLDYIMSNQASDKIKAEPFQVWTIRVDEGQAATIRVEDGNKNLVETFRIPFTDFPLMEYSLWFIDGTLLLPSEY